MGMSQRKKRILAIYDLRRAMEGERERKTENILSDDKDGGRDDKREIRRKRQGGKESKRKQNNIDLSIED